MGRRLHGYAWEKSAPYEGGKTLRELGCSFEATLFNRPIFALFNGEYQIFLKTLTGKTVTLDVDRLSQIDTVKSFWNRWKAFHEDSSE